MPEKNPYPHLAQWVEAAQEGDAQAFGLIYDALLTPVYRYIYYRVPHHLAEDLTEDTFLKVWENIKKYKSTSSFASWVFRIAHNLICDHYRKFQEPLELNERMASSAEAQPDVQMDAQLTQDYLRRAIKQLDEPYEQIIILRYVNELSHEEIAQIMGKSQGAVRTLQTRAIQKLSLILKEKEKRETK